MRVQVAIIGGGPSGLLLAQKLSRAGIECQILERRSRRYVLSRIRAGVLERGTVDQLRQVGVGTRMDCQGLEHHGCLLSDGHQIFSLNFHKLIGKSVMVYGQTEVTRDLYDALDRSGVVIRHNVEDVSLHDIDTDSPRVTWQEKGQFREMVCDYIAGCDGFYGPSRTTIPDSIKHEFERSYPFGWLGILSQTPPVEDELIYSRSSRGFALASMRNPSLSRYYIQVPADEKADQWSDEQFWSELRRRFPEEVAQKIVTGPSIEKSVAPLRSFVCEPMSYGRLFLCGDAAHIVPPTGAKGLNLAASDVHYLFEALREYYADQSSSGLQNYSDTALRRVWKSMRFSWSLTHLMHIFPDHTPFDARIQIAEFRYLRQSKAAQRAFAENYTGLPYH